jgi:hypothetical protein
VQPAAYTGLSLQAQIPQGAVTARSAMFPQPAKKAGGNLVGLAHRVGQVLLGYQCHNVLGRMAVNQSALVETLIQLSEFRQYDKAESLLAVCTREQLEQLHAISDRAFSKRIAYSLEKQLKRNGDRTNKVKDVLLFKLMKIFNAWCLEGHRTAIRCVLGVMENDEILALSCISELDREVYSMLREFDALYEPVPCDCPK